MFVDRINTEKITWFITAVYRIYFSLVFGSHTPRANALGVHYTKHLVKIYIQQLHRHIYIYIYIATSVKTTRTLLCQLSSGLV